MSIKFTNEHLEWFKKYLRVQLEGDYNMYLQASDAANKAGLTSGQYEFVFNNYMELNSQFPSIRKEIESSIMSSMK